MSYDPHKNVRELFPIFTAIEFCVKSLNHLLEYADRQGLSIRFTQENQKVSTLDGRTFDGPVKPKINITTLSWNYPQKDKDD